MWPGFPDQTDHGLNFHKTLCPILAVKIKTSTLPHKSMDFREFIEVPSGSLRQGWALVSKQVRDDHQGDKGGYNEEGHHQRNGECGFF